jgi:hypothetical protein
MRRILIGVVVATLVFGTTGSRVAWAQVERPTPAATEPGPAAALGWGMAAVGTNLGYIPAKMLYALTGGLVGLLAWGVTLGNSDVALSILQPALGGTWVITPEMLRGEQPLMPVGPSYEAKSDHSSL